MYITSWIIFIKIIDGINLTETCSFEVSCPPCIDKIAYYRIVSMYNYLKNLKELFSTIALKNDQDTPCCAECLLQKRGILVNVQNFRGILEIFP